MNTAPDHGAEPKPEPIINMVGEKVALGPWHSDLLPYLTRWDNDFDTAGLRGDEARPHSPEAVAAHYQAMLTGERPDWTGFVIYELPDLRLIGVANIRDYTNPHGTAEFGISIGEHDCWGKGYGTEATKLILDYAFTVLGVHNVWLDTVGYNERAMAAYRRAGFQELGRRRQAHLIGGQRHDVVLMDCVASDFEPPARRAIPSVSALQPRATGG